MRTLRKILAVLFPPLVVLAYGTKREWYINLALTLLFYIPGSIHALMIVTQRT